VQLVCTNEMWGEKKEKITEHVIQKWRKEQLCGKFKGRHTVIF
jgi:hypothetical protein